MLAFALISSSHVSVKDPHVDYQMTAFSTPYSCYLLSKAPFRIGQPIKSKHLLTTYCMMLIVTHRLRLASSHVYHSPQPCVSETSKRDRHKRVRNQLYKDPRRGGHDFEDPAPCPAACLVTSKRPHPLTPSQ